MSDLTKLSVDELLNCFTPYKEFRGKPEVYAEIRRRLERSEQTREALRALWQDCDDGGFAIKDPIYEQVRVVLENERD